MLSDFWRFLVAVFWHWQAWLGGSGGGGALIVVLALYERLTGARMSRRMYIVVFVIGFLFLAFFMAWREQWEWANTAELALKSGKPDFELSYGTVMVAGMEITSHDGSIDKYTAVLIPVTVFNRGVPSVIGGWKLFAKLESGEILQGVPFGPPGEKFTFSGPRGNLMTLRTSSSLFRSGTVAPIAAGGQADGFVLFQFPAQHKDAMKQKGRVLTLEIVDITHRLYEKIIPLTGTEATSFYMSPGMQP